jgi:hypothetical protein
MILPMRGKRFLKEPHAVENRGELAVTENLHLKIVGATKIRDATLKEKASFR